MSFSRFLQRNYPADPARFFQSPPGRRLVARAEQEHEGEVHAQRAALAERVAEHERQLADALPGLLKGEVEARVAHDRLKKQTDGAAARLRIAHDKRLGAQMSAENQIVALKAQLRRTAPPAIDAFIDQLRAEHEELRQTPYVSHQEPNGYRGRQPIAKHFSNAAAAKRRLAGLLVAIRELEELKATATPADALPGIFQAIHAALPNADQLEEITPIAEHIGQAWAASN